MTTLLEKPKEGRVSRWDPFRELEEEFGRFWTTPWPIVSRWPCKEAMRWRPRIDMFEKEGTLVVRADLPGMKKEDVRVSLDEGDLVIEGESKKETEVKEDDYYRLERSSGSFYRRVALPFQPDPARIDAGFKDGVLEIRIPKPKEIKPEPQKVTVR